MIRRRFKEVKVLAFLLELKLHRERRRRDSSLEVLGVLRNCLRLHVLIFDGHHQGIFVKDFGSRSYLKERQ
jgi:hypothetical protein